MHGIDAIQYRLEHFILEITELTTFVRRKNEMHPFVSEISRFLSTNTFATIHKRETIRVSLKLHNSSNKT